MILSLLLSLILALGSAAALVIGSVDTVRACRKHCPPEQPIGLLLLAASFAGLSFASWPR